MKRNAPEAGAHHFRELGIAPLGSSEGYATGGRDMRVLRLAWLGIRTEAVEAMVEFFGRTLGLQLDHADDNGSVFVLPGGGKVEVDGPRVADWAHFTTGPVAGFLVDDVVAATEELRQAGIAILSGPFVFETGVAWVHFRGPDGNVYGLTQGPDLEPAEVPE